MGPPNWIYEKGYRASDTRFINPPLNDSLLAQKHSWNGCSLEWSTSIRIDPDSFQYPKDYFANNNIKSRSTIKTSLVTV